MKTTVTESMFVRAFENMGRAEGWTEFQLRCLYQDIIQMEDDTDTEIELDVIAIDCEFAPYDTLAEFLHDYPQLEGEVESVEDIMDHTNVIDCHGDGFIIQMF